jgi:hypothetical protein
MGWVAGPAIITTPSPVSHVASLAFPFGILEFQEDGLVASSALEWSLVVLRYSVDRWVA